MHLFAGGWVAGGPLVGDTEVVHDVPKRLPVGADETADRQQRQDDHQCTERQAKPACECDLLMRALPFGRQSRRLSSGAVSHSEGIGRRSGLARMVFAAWSKRMRSRSGAAWRHADYLIGDRLHYPYGVLKRPRPGQASLMGNPTPIWGAHGISMPMSDFVDVDRRFACHIGHGVVRKWKRME